MRVRRGRRRDLVAAARVAVAVAVLATATARATACSIPVFRYALDRWPADRYRLEVPAPLLRTEPLATEFRNLGTGSALNLDAAAGLVGGARLVFPGRDRQPESVVWSGTLAPASYAVLTDSPVRRELVARILGGASAVWVVVDGGEAAADDALAGRIRARARFLESAIGLPPIDPGDPSSRLGPGPALRVDLGVLRVRRDSPAEGVFVRQLAGPSGLDAFPAGTPFAALVFGRGRVLGAWPAARLTEDFIEEATRFLIGSCSCEVKSLNPGWDLLLRVDWEAGLAEAERLRRTGPPPGITPAAAPAPPAPAIPETVTFPVPSPTPAGAPVSPGNDFWASKRGCLAIVAGAGALMFLLTLSTVRSRP